MAENKPKLSLRQYIRAIWEVAKISFRTAPGPIVFKLAGIVVTAGLPVIITFFAARTTTELAAAFQGRTGAGHLALEYIVITAILGLVTTIWNTFDQYVQQVMRYRVESKVSDMMYQHFLALDFWQYDDKNTADLYDRAQKFSQFFAYVFDRVARLISQLVATIIAIIALFVVLPWLALAVLVAVIPGVYVQVRLSRSQIAHWNRNVESRRSRSYIEWSLLQPQAIADIRLGGLVQHFMQLRHKYREMDDKGSLEFERQFIGKRLLSDALLAVTEVGALLYIGFEIINQRQPIGQFIYVQSLTSRAMTSASGFISDLSTLDEDLANLFDYQQFMELPVRQGGSKRLKATVGVIAFDDVSFSYLGAKRQTLQHVSLTIRRGEHIAIVGENGAGKSTFLKLLTGLYAPSSGLILIDGTDLQKINLEDYHARMSVLQQEVQRYKFVGVHDNVVLGNVSKPVDEPRITDALRQAEASGFVAKLPQKDQTLLANWLEDDDGNKGVDLSGGQWQRLALARNFYRDADIIILDEPTSAIDALAESKIFERLFEHANKKTVITVSHRLSTVRRADVIYVLKDGQLVETGTHQQLAAEDGEYRRIFGKQF